MTAVADSARGDDARASRHSATLDLLRAIAIALVLLRHGERLSPHPIDASGGFLATLAANVANNGWLGVDLFFVLSGFLIARQILVLRATGNWRLDVFLAKRAFRTLPAFLFVFLALWAGFLADSLGTVGVLDPTVLLAHLAFLNDYFGSPVLVTLWSLATEEKFYLSMGLVLPFVGGSPRAKAIALIGLAFVVAALRTSAYFEAPQSGYLEFFWSYRAPFHFACDGLLIGAAVAAASLAYRVSADGTTRFVSALAAAIALLVLCATAWSPDGRAGGALIAIPVFSLLAAVIVLHAGSVDRVLLAWPLLMRPARALARISYSLYLVHYPVAQLAARWAADGDAGRSAAAYWSAYLVVSILGGAVLYATVERGGFALRDRVVARLQSR